MTTPRTRLIALLGHPISASRSPAMMTSAFEAFGLDATYIAADLPSAADVAPAIRGLRALGALGANVTMPYKRLVLDLCDEVDTIARHAGAVNTLRFDSDRTVGTNTDATGCVRALEGIGVVMQGARVIILGAGGAARAAAAGALTNGAAHVTLISRRGRDARAAAEEIDGFDRERGAALPAGRTNGASIADLEGWRELAVRADVVIQATPAGMRREPADEHGTDVAGYRQPAQAHERFRTESEAHDIYGSGLFGRELLDIVPNRASVMDMVYRPRNTEFLAYARDRGHRTLGGHAMLAWQGALALEYWFRKGFDGQILLQSLDENAADG